MAVSGFDNRKQERLAPVAHTQAAEGPPRPKFSRADIEQMTPAGGFADGERFESIGGELVEMMHPKGVN